MLLMTINDDEVLFSIKLCFLCGILCIIFRTQDIRTVGKYIATEQFESICMICTEIPKLLSVFEIYFLRTWNLLTLKA